MHAIIKIEKSVHGVLYYHERKLKQGVAECLYAGNMIKDARDLTLKDKQFYLQRLESLNDRVERRTVSVMLSCHRDDSPDNDQMRRLGQEYMKELGWEQQPYLVYRHRDAAHHHLHIVATRIRADGSLIRITPALLLHSLELSRKLEVKFGLRRARGRIADDEWRSQHPVQAIQYGVTPLKPTMNAVLESVLGNRVYTSLDELNVILRPFRIKASRGREDSITYKNNGLLYYPLNERGEQEKTYIKSSSLKCKPTLRYLQQRFAENRVIYEQVRQRVQTSVDWVFFKQRVSMEALRQALRQEKIDLVQGEGQRMYYVDRLSKAVLSADGLRERCISAEEYQRQTLVQVQKQQLKQRPKMDLE